MTLREEYIIHATITIPDDFKEMQRVCAVKLPPNVELHVIYEKGKVDKMAEDVERELNEYLVELQKRHPERMRIPEVVEMERRIWFAALKEKKSAKAVIKRLLDEISTQVDLLP